MATNTKGVYYRANTDAASTLEAQALASADSVPVGPNYLINGAFDFWQRGTSFTSTAYTADRWYSPISGGTVSQEVSDLPTGFQYGIKYTSTGATQFGQFNQPIERATVISLRGKTVTVSGWVKISGAYVGNWLSQAYYSNSTDAYASLSTYVTGSQKIVATSSTTSWTRFSNTFVVPTDAVGLKIENLPDSYQPSGVTIRMTGLQLEEGSYATAFRRNGSSIQAELAACQRYYQKSYNVAVAPGSATNEGAVYQGLASDVYGNATYRIPFQVPMRAIPSATIYTINGASTYWEYQRSGVSNTNTVGNWTGGWPGSSGGMIYFGVGVGHAVCTVFGHWVMNAEL